MTRRSRREFLGQSAAIAALAGAGSAVSAQTGARPDDLSLPAFKPLFNGRDLSGWKPMANDNGTWSVRNNTIVCSGRPNGLLGPTTSWSRRSRRISR